MQAEFRDLTMAKEFTWQTFTLIPKGKSRNFTRIRMVEVYWKTISSLLNSRLTAEITFHYVLHSFWEVRGMGTAKLKANLIQYLASMSEAVIFEIFLDI